MGIIHRYLLTSFLRNLAYTMLGALVLFTLMDLLDHMGSFVDNSATASMVLRYYLFKGAWIVDTVLPIAVLIETLGKCSPQLLQYYTSADIAGGWRNAVGYAAVSFMER